MDYSPIHTALFPLSLLIYIITQLEQMQHFCPKFFTDRDCLPINHSATPNPLLPCPFPYFIRHLQLHGSPLFLFTLLPGHIAFVQKTPIGWVIRGQPKIFSVKQKNFSSELKAP